ncbi:hypothetical protein BVX98_00145 [bacterium F11]|nr:hypothetical protein BVX98_00145 [bacterium F11]
MFFQSDKSQPKIETIIGAGTELAGNIRTNESVRVDGKVIGEVSAESVVVGEKGVIQGNITTNNVVVGGRVKGNISSGSNLEILSHGHVFGDIQTVKLIIADGATFEGNCHMVKTEPQIIEMTPDIVSSEGNDTQHNGKNLKVISNTKK